MTENIGLQITNQDNGSWTVTWNGRRVKITPDRDEAIRSAIRFLTTEIEDYYNHLTSGAM